MGHQAIIRYPIPYSNEFKELSVKINVSGPNKTFAIFHVHPNSSGMNPSTPENNYKGNNFGDTGIADKYNLTFYVMHKNGLTVYDPATKKSTTLRDNLEWVTPCPP
jgi:hypothetical protein